MAYELIKFFDSDFIQSRDLMFAFGVTAYDSNPEPIEDASYGVVKPFYKSWGLYSSVSGVKWEPLPMR